MWVSYYFYHYVLHSTPSSRALQQPKRLVLPTRNHPLRHWWRSVSSLLSLSITISLNPPWCLGVRLQRLSGLKWPNLLLDEWNSCLRNHVLRYDPRWLQAPVSVITHSGKPTHPAEWERERFRDSFRSWFYFLLYWIASLSLLVHLSFQPSIRFSKFTYPHFGISFLLRFLSGF